MNRALLLNADYSPLHFISDERAIVLVYIGHAEVVEMNGAPSVWDGEYFVSPSTKIAVPATVRLTSRITKKWKQPRFRRKVLFNRDGWKCQYCSEELNWSSVTMDHVHPSSRGGDTSWKNCVAACKPCNRKKANRTPDEANMRLLKAPVNPTPLHFWDISKTSAVHPDWEAFIPKM